METIIRAGGPADLIAYAWFRMGYRPAHSLTLIGMREGRRIGVVARLDLPQPKDQRAALARLTDMVVEAGDDGFVAVVTSPAPARTFRGLIRALRSQARSDGLDLLDAYLVGEATYGSLVCKDPDCCPPNGLPVSDILASPVAVAMVVDGRPLHEDEAGLVADVEPVGTAFGSVVTVGDEPEPEVTSVQEAEVVMERRVAWWYRWLALVVGSDAAAPADVEWLIPALENLRFRDAVLLSLPYVSRSIGSDGGSDGGPTATEVAADVLAGGDGHRHLPPQDWDPDEEVLQRATQLLAAVARSAPAGRRAEALAVLAWTAWWSGEGTRARLLVDRALADQPGHRLASLVGEALRRAVRPGWASREDDEAQV